jgi:hypothetical protein
VVCVCDVFNLGEFEGEMSNFLVVDIYIRGVLWLNTSSDSSN